MAVEEHEDDLLKIADIATILLCNPNRVNHLAKRDPLFPQVAANRINKSTGKAHRYWRRGDIEAYKADRIISNAEYRAALRRHGVDIPLSTLPIAILTKDELRAECERLRNVVASMSECTTV